MTTEQYSLTRKPYIVLGVLFFIILSLGAYLSRTSNWDCIYKIIISIYVVYTIIIIIEVALRHLLYFLFTKENNMWVKEIDRPRLAITAISIFFMYLSFDTYISNLGNPFNQGLSVLICFLSFTLLLLGWSDRFKMILLPRLREAIGKPTPIIANTSEFEEACLEQIKYQIGEKYISGNVETIDKLLRYNTTIDKIEIIQEKDKLEWICQSGLNNNQKFNSQTLLSFMSNLYNTEDSTIIIDIVRKVFKEEYHISFKNISTWRTNKSKYLKIFENDLVNLISDRNLS